jgi:hypothetical protein
MLGAFDDAVGRDHGADLDLRVDLGPGTAPFAWATGSALPTGRAATTTTTTTAATTTTTTAATAASATPPLTLARRRFLGAHGRQVNGCRSIAASLQVPGGHMALRVVGAGVGRTGTASLQLALQQLLAGRCYHMGETFGRPDDIPVWHAAVNGTQPDWSAFLHEFVATVDWPACAFWRELSEANPDAIVLLSTRTTADAWWTSANDTILQVLRRPVPDDHEHVEVIRPQVAMIGDMFARTFTPAWQEAGAAKQAYDEHNAAVRAGVDPARLVEWQPGDGWEPICAALDLPVPDEPFPHVNSTADFRTMIGLDE